ncbi:leucine--tRNA ligase, putative [Plasmodium sp. gorilla clade G2]|uniref:leucine--tRNA ligase, putative n=1 Tax=Plasmodium sp. gorilla clade G2 TaxID=880535 RepID=UPI000D21695E|nr:leucine--tRNA ligase, putative [Plasmodium sp. gorilla clade G2]SOV12637.1 leucine--tRNA ligase, putative [Plasmodium sp. gorilla clade G2]
MARRMNLLTIEKNIQNLWKEHNIYEKEFIDINESRYTGNFPYPYMNGLLHIGHAFTLSKLDFIVRYKNMICDNVLLPFSFHCTGTPIVVCADKLKNELNKKNKEDFEKSSCEKKEDDNNSICTSMSDDKNNNMDENKLVDVTDSNKKNTDVTVFRSNKSKAQSKGIKQNTQYDIMKQMKIKDEEIHLFQNPEHWCYYFSSKAKDHLYSFGLYCDWRRSFITTNINPYYDKFVNWHINTLYKKNLIYYGSRITIFSKYNNQACADHERSEGEGVKCQEYTLIKIFVSNAKDFYNIFMKNIKDRDSIQNDCNIKKETMNNKINIQMDKNSSNKSNHHHNNNHCGSNIFFTPFEKDEEDLKNKIWNEDFFVKDKKVIFLGSTLKPETAYGQNYTFINPNEYYYITLGFYKQHLHYGDKSYVNNIMTKEEIIECCPNIYVCSENSLYNLAYQGIIPLLKNKKNKKNIKNEHVLIKSEEGNQNNNMQQNVKNNNMDSNNNNNNNISSSNNNIDSVYNLSDIFILNKIKGEDFVGLETYTNMSKIKNLYILPMTTIKMNISTGIVPCVSSDSTDDYACLEDIKKKKNYYCEKYNLKEHYLNNISESCIELPEIGNNSGKYFYEKEKVSSYKDVKLQKIKEVLYKKQYFEGIMTVDPYKGMKTFNCRKIAKQSIIRNNDGFLYSEPEVMVIDRNNVKCIAALCNQWYINYGNLEFKKDVLIQLKKNNFQTYNEVLYKQLQHVIFWLDDWSCSRSYGLGTCMPQFNQNDEINQDNEINQKNQDNQDNQDNQNNQDNQDNQDNQNNLHYNNNVDIMKNNSRKELIESLSDSTIYMAYYTVSHFLQGSVDGQKKGLLDISADDLNDSFFDYIFDISDDTSNISKHISKEKLLRMRREFTYWYPFDVRISGKDLIFNHLTMALFNHVAIWGKKKKYDRNKEDVEERSILDRQTEILNELENMDLSQYETIKYFPRSFFCNGHVLVNKEKMSKSKGNFITIEESIALYTSDGTRIALADAGDSIEDSNFNTDTANSAIMKLYNLINFSIETKNNVYIFRCGEKTFNDLIFENEINYLTNKCKESYEKLLFRDVLKYGFYDMLLKRDTYRMMCDKIHMHKETVNFFIERICIIINPIIPHVTEHIWTYILKKDTFLVKQKWPTLEETNYSIVMHKQNNNLLNVIEIFKKSYDKVINKCNKQKVVKDKNLTKDKKNEKGTINIIKNDQQNKKNNDKNCQIQNNISVDIKKENNNNNNMTNNTNEINHIHNNNKDDGVDNLIDVDDEEGANYYKEDEEERMKFKAIVYVAREYNDTQKKIIEILNNIINNSNDKKLPTNYINLLVQNTYVNNLPKNEKKDILSFATFLVKDNVTLNNNQYELSLPYDEIQLIKDNVDFIKRSLNLGDIQVLENYKKSEIDNTDIFKMSNPGNPSIYIYNTET